MPLPLNGSTVRDMGRNKSSENASNASDPQLLRPTGAWAGYLIFGLCLLVFVVFAAQAAYNDEWARLTLWIVMTMAFVTVPTGGAKWLRRELQRRRTR